MNIKYWRMERNKWTTFCRWKKYPHNVEFQVSSSPVGDRKEPRLPMTSVIQFFSIQNTFMSIQTLGSRNTVNLWGREAWCCWPHHMEKIRQSCAHLTHGTQVLEGCRVWPTTQRTPSPESQHSHGSKQAREPSSLLQICLGNFWKVHMKWSSWGASVASRI